MATTGLPADPDDFEDDGSIVNILLEKPSTFLSLTSQVRNAVEHLISALALVKMIDSTESATLGTLDELHPLVKSFKSFKGGNVAALKALEENNEGGSKKDNEEKHQEPVEGEEGGEGKEGDADEFDLEEEEEESEEEKQLLEKITKSFLALSRNPKKRKPNFRRVFEEMDVDNSGCLDHEELKNALVALQIPLTDEEMKTLIKRLDLDGDGRVDYMEFIKFVHVGGEEGDGVLSTDRVEDALTHLSRAIFLYSDHNFFNMRAECYFRLHDLKSCISNLRYVLKLLPGDQDTRKKLARVLDLQGINWLKARNYKAGESCFSESCKLDPIASTFWVHKSIALVYAEDYSEALKAVEQAMSVEQATADVYCLKGKIHWALDLIDSGNRDFRMAQELAPDHPEVVSYISTMIKKSGDFYNAAMEKLQTLNLNSPSENVDEISEAVRLLTQALALVPDDMRLLILRAKAHRAMKSFDKSLTDIDDAAFNYCKSMLGDEVPKFVPNRRMWLETQAMKGKYREPIIVTQQRSLTLTSWP